MGDCSWSPTLFPADAGTPSINQHSRWWLARNVTKWPGDGGYSWSVTGEVQWLIGLCTTGLGIAVPPLPLPVGCHWTISRCCGRMGMQNGGQRPGLWRCGAPVKTQMWNAMGTRPPTGPGRLSTGDHRPAFGAAGRSAGISVVFLISYGGRLKRSHLHCRADALALLGLSVLGGRDICRCCPLPLRYATVLCFAASVCLVCGPRPQ